MEVIRQQKPTANKHQVYMVSGNEAYLQELGDVVSPYYRARRFNDTSTLIDALYENLPKSLIIDATLDGTSAMRLITTVRVNFDSAKLPIIFTVMEAQETWIAEASKVEGLACLTKPYHTSDLIETISQQINTSIEANWDHIEPVQQAALKQTLTFYNSIADTIMNGDIVEYNVIEECCGPLVEAVENKNYKDILYAIREHDNYTYVHSIRTATFLCAFGQSIGITGQDLKTLTIGGFLLDVGKNYIPNDLLNKEAPLEGDEYTIIQEHVRYGTSFLNQVSDLPKGVTIIAEQHHEKIDGSGYPHQLKGVELNNLARMAAIVDVFCALTDRRSYRPARSAHLALSTMAKMQGHLDRTLLVHFGEMLLDAPTVN